MTEATSTPTLDTSTISEASNLQVLDSTGASIRFGSIFEAEKVIVAISSVEYAHSVSSLAYNVSSQSTPADTAELSIQLASARKEALEEANIKIVVVGCGDWQPINHYTESTGFQGPIYADPTRALYKALGMTTETLAQTPVGQTKRSYLKSGMLSNALQSIWRGPMKNPALVGKQGSISQLGGDFVFGPGNICSFASRMQHTEDHVEVADLMQAAGVAYQFHFV